MKKNDIAIIILIVSISLVGAYFLGQAFLGGESSKSAQVEVVEKISPTVKDPDPKIFNANAINPTIPINIGNPSNQQPF
jgi:hypothetical protein